MSWHPYSLALWRTYVFPVSPDDDAAGNSIGCYPDKTWAGVNRTVDHARLEGENKNQAEQQRADWYIFHDDTPPGEWLENVPF